MTDGSSISQISSIENRILQIRGQRVILDFDLAELYGVTTTRLNEQVKRNLKRFPLDFMFALSNQEFRILKSHFATSNGRGGRRKIPLAFTEHGVIMAANVLHSEQAIEASVQVVRAFIKLREMLVAHKDLARKLNELEKKYDHQFAVVFDAIRQLMAPPSRPPKRIGFKTDNKQQP